MTIRNLLWGVAVAVLLMCMLSIAEGSHVSLGAVARMTKLGRKEAGFAKVNFCDKCLQLSQEALKVLTNPETSMKVIRTADHVLCDNLQPGLKKKCERMVTDYVPQAFLELEKLFGPQKLCYESGLCMAPAIRAFQDEKKICLICESLATDALTYLDNNRTREEIVVALHLACAQMKELSKQCALLVDLYAPRMMEELGNITPQSFCQKTRMCKPLKVLDSNDCATCQFFILEIKIKLQDPKTQERVLDVLTNACNRITNHVEECKSLVAQYGPIALADIDKILDAQAVCCKAGICKSRVCPQKAEAWTETMTELFYKDEEPLIALPQERLISTN